MEKKEQQIEVGFSYASQMDKGSSEIRQSCVAHYKKHFETARQLDDKHRIFLDANVLLGYYQLPIEARRKLWQFLESNKDRIYLCDQVQVEFSQHRAAVMKHYQAKLVLESPTAYQKEVRPLIEDFLEQNDDVLAAYPSFKEELKGVYENSEAILQHLKTWGTEKIEQCKKQFLQDDILELIPELQQLPRLKLEEYRLLRQEFDQLRTAAETFQPGDKAASIDAYLYKQPSRIFPGVADIKKKPKAYGDYYIFHEIIKWIANNPQDAPVIFLTNDVTKKDWVDSDKRAYFHYLENMYLNTEDVFYILHAEDIFSDVLGQSFAHLVTSEAILEDLDAAVAAERADGMTPTSIQTLLQELYPNRVALEESDDFWQELIEDLENDFDLQSLYELREVLLENYHLLVQLELERYRVYDQLDALEVTLEIAYE